MDSKVVFWSAATLNMALLWALAAFGVRRVRAGNTSGHRRAMLVSAGLVVFFLVSYLFKLLLLGREDLSVWTPAAVWALRFHELCVFTMLISGGLALRRGMALAHTRALSPDEAAPEPLPRDLHQHRRAGRIAVVAGGLALLSAGAVLRSMYERAGL
jgi:uncharacterized membrane protein YozB (DUF420 family)